MNPVDTGRVGVTLLTGDALSVLKTLLAESVRCCVTSPPYWGLRDYGVDGQMGLEATPELWCEKLVAVMREVRRVLTTDGTLWLNLGDSYYSPRTVGTVGQNSTINGQQTQAAYREAAARIGRTAKAGQNRSDIGDVAHRGRVDGLKAKDLVGIPWLAAFALRSDGWWLRSDIVWSKPNPMPESVNDRPTRAHEYVFLLSKSERYYFDAAAINEPVSPNTHARMSQDVMRQVGSFRANGGAKTNGPMRAVLKGSGRKSVPAGAGIKANESFHTSVVMPVDRRNARSVWTIATQPYRGAHFATFPGELARRCVAAGSAPGDTVLDPFGGSGTVASIAISSGRRSLYIEINPAYVELARARIGPLLCAG